MSGAMVRLTSSRHPEEGNMVKFRKTDAVVSAMKAKDLITIAEIRLNTGLLAAEIGGILASLERKERVVKHPPMNESGRNRWRLLKAEKRQVSRVISVCSHQRLIKDQSSVERDKVGLELQNLFAKMSRNNALALRQGLNA
jgi:hypothetical protein